jgi:hypothetical protein
VKLAPRTSRSSYKLKLKPCVKRRPLASGKYRLAVGVVGSSSARRLTLRVRR